MSIASLYGVYLRGLFGGSNSRIIVGFNENFWKEELEDLKHNRLKPCTIISYLFK